MQARKPKSGHPTGPSGRPSFGVGPIARVSTATPPAAGQRPGYPPLPVMARGGAFGLPNLRRNVCPHFYMTGHARGDPDPGAAPAQGAHPPGRERLALPAPRRRPPRAGLRQRCLPDPALQPVRLLRGRADPGVTASDLTYEEALRGPRSDRGRFGIRLGLGRTRALLARARRSAAVVPRGAGRRDERQGQRARPGRLGPPGGRLPRRPRRPSRTSSAIGSGSRSAAGSSIRRRSPGSSARSLDAADRIARRLGAADRVRAADRGRLPLVRRVRRRPGHRRGRARRSARRDPRLGRRRRGDHQRRSRPHRPARRHGHGDRPREGRDHRARRPGRDRRDRRRARRSSGGGRAGWACR